MQEHKRTPVAAFHVVQSDAIDLQELPARRVIAFRFLGDLPIYDRYGPEEGSCPCKGRKRRVSPQGSGVVRLARGRACSWEFHVQYLWWSARCLREIEKCCRLSSTVGAESSFQTYLERFVVAVAGPGHSQLIGPARWGQEMIAWNMWTLVLFNLVTLAKKATG